MSSPRERKSLRGSAGVAGPKQDRSRRTFERIVRSARAVVAERGVEDAGMNEIARRAGVSVGNVYRRFESKEALLDYLEEEFLAGRAEFWKELLSAGGRFSRPRALLRRVVEEIVRRHREHRRFLRAIALRARDDYETRVAREHSEGISLLTKKLADLGCRRPRREVGFALEVVSAAAGEFILFGRSRALGARVTDRTITRELTNLVLRYLRIRQP